MNNSLLQKMRLDVERDECPTWACRNFDKIWHDYKKCIYCQENFILWPEWEKFIEKDLPPTHPIQDFWDFRAACQRWDTEYDLAWKNEDWDTIRELEELLAI